MHKLLRLTQAQKRPAVRLGRVLRLLSLLLLLGPAAWAQYGFSTAANGSLTADANGNAIDMSTGTTQLVAASQDNISSGLRPLPFTFTFGGTAFTQFSASSNGLIRLGGTSIAGGTYTVSSGTAALPILSAFGSDLSTGPSGKVHSKVVGTSPNQTLVVEFLNMSLLYQASPSNNGTYQVRFYESSGNVEFVYGAMTRNTGSSAANGQQVGIGYAAGSTAGSFVYILSATNAGSSTGSFTQQTYPTGTIANLNSSADGSRRVYLLTPPVPCSGTPTAGTATAASSSFCSGGTTTISLTGTTSGVTGLTYQWQESTDNQSFANVTTGTGGTTATYTTPALTATRYYRAVVSCGSNSATSTTATITILTPAYASLPFTEGFESTWTSVCGTREIPTSFWKATPVTGANSWRRDDDGVAGAGWSSSSGAYSPLGSNAGGASSSRSARFHSWSTTSTGTLDLYLNTSSSTLTLNFDYINTNGSDKIDILLSTDGGQTFGSSLLSVVTAATWTRQTLALTGTTATTVVRFRATGDNGTTDIGLDNVSVVVPAANDASITALTAPTATLFGCSPTQDVTVTVKNNGSSDLTGVPVQVLIGGPITQTLTGTYTGTLAAGASASFTVGQIDMSAAGTYTFNASTQLSGDGNTANDALPQQSRTVEAPTALPIAETFGIGTTLPSGWTTSGFSVSSIHGNGTGSGVYKNLYNLAATGSVTTLKLGPVTGTPTLTFDARFLNYTNTNYPTAATATTLGANDKLEVQVSTDCGVTYTTVYTVNSANYNGTGTASTSFYGYSTPLTGVSSGQTAYVRLLATWGAGDYFLDIDNVNIFIQVAADAGITALVGPAASGCYSATENVTVTIKNNGLNTLTSIPVQVAVSGAATQTLTGTYTGSLAAGASTDFIVGQLDMTAAGTYTFNATTQLSGDGNAANDALAAQTRTVTAPQGTFPLSENFNASSSLPTNWTTGGSPTFSISTTQGVGSSNAPRAETYYGGQSHLTTPLLGPLSASNLELTFDAKFINYSSGSGFSFTAGDKLEVQVAPCGSTYTTVYTINASNVNGTGTASTSFYNYAAIPLTGLSAGQNVRVRFLVTAGSGSDFYTTIDNVVLRMTPALDAGITALVGPAASGCYSATENVTVTIKNNGLNTLTSIPVQVAVSGAATQTLTGTFSGSLAAGASTDFTVGQLDMTAAGTYTFNATTQLSGDGNAANDALAAQTRTRTALVTQPQQLNFTGYTGGNLTTLYPAWREASGATLPGGTTSNWINDDFANVVGGPNGTAAKINLDGNTDQEWIVGPRVAAISSTVLTYSLAMTQWNATTTGTLGSDDKLQVMISTDCGASFTALRTYDASSTISNTGQQETIGLGSYAGQEIIVAFFATEGTVDNAADNDVFIDNISLSSPLPGDLALERLSSPLVQRCYGTAEPVVVRLRNLGTQAFDLSLTPVTVTVDVTGAVTQTLPLTVSTGTLAPNDTLRVTLGTLDMTTYGTYTFAATLSSSGDANATNNALSPTVSRTVAAPVAGTVAPGTYTLCNSGTATLTLTGSANGSIQWQSSPDNQTFTDISGATAATYTTPTLTSTTYFRARTYCGSAEAVSNVATATVTNPQITATSPVQTTCEGTTATLTATGSAGTTVRLYSAVTGGTLLATGTAGAGTLSYTTPALTSTGTQNYYAEAVNQTNETAGRPTPAGVASSSASDYGLVFNATAPFVLNSVDVYPTGTAGNLVLRVVNSAGTLIPGLSATVAIPAGNSTTPVAYTVPLNFAIPVGTGMRLMATSSPALVRDLSPGGFPYNSASGTVSVTGGYAFSASSTNYYYFYNWQTSKDCASAPRTAIGVDVTAAPALTVTPSTTQPICVGQSVTVTAAGSGYTSYSYAPMTGVTLTSADGSTATLAPTTSTTYTITAAGAAGGCSTAQTLTINVGVTPSAPVVTPASPTVCTGGSVVASASVATVDLVPTATFDSGLGAFTLSSTGATGTGFAIQTAPYTGTGTGAPSGYNGPTGSTGGKFLVANSAAGGSGSTTNTQLTSPAFSTVGFAAATVNFQQYYKYFSADVTARVEYTINGGTTWTTLTDYKTAATDNGTSTGVQAVRQLALPAAALGQNAVQVRFNYQSVWGYYWALDNVGVSGTPTVTYAVTPAAGVTVNGSTITFSPAGTTSYSVTASSGSCAGPATAVTVTVSDVSTWTGAVSTAWTEAGNWNGCVPSQTVSALIPAGAPRYPVLPTLSGGYDVNSLTINSGATFTHSGSNLRVWGDLTNSGTATLTGGTIAFRGGAAQSVTGSLSFNNLTVNKSADTLRILSNQTVAADLTLTNGILKTYSTSTSYQVTLGGTLSETASSFVLGSVVTNAALGTDGASSTFGGLGLTLTAHSTGGASLPGATTVMRTTGKPMYGMSGSTSIRRQFNIQPTTDSNLNVDMVFGYADSAFELQGIGEGSLTLFSNATVPGGWRQEGYSSRDANANTVTLNGLNHLSLWTLGSEAAPLPVSLTSFVAKRQGADAELTWTTAQEKNNQGFEVQVSTDGRTYRPLGFVRSESPNSTTGRRYSFVDREAGKQGLRYYRLRQLDLDGTQAFFGPKTAQFEGATAASLDAFPNPFAQQLTLRLHSTVAQPGTLIRLFDANGRTVLTRKVDVPAGASEQQLTDLGPLPSGVYSVQLTLNGKPLHLKLVKE